MRDELICTVHNPPGAPAPLLTWDQGTEMAKHHELTLATDMQVYFCDPHSPWQRGSNENTTACCASTSQGH